VASVTTVIAPQRLITLSWLTSDFDWTANQEHRNLTLISFQPL
jgi:hypothetical protein